MLYRHCRHALVQAVRPLTVAADGPDGTLLWLPRDTPVRTARYVDGRPVRDVPIGERFTQPWHTGPGTWTGTDLLLGITPCAWHTVNWFFDLSGRFLHWYLNIETPPMRWDDSDVGGAAGFDSDDLELDLVVTPDHAHRLKDEDELEAATAAGDLPPAVLDRVWAETRSLLEAVAARRPPFDRPPAFRPDPSWAPPTLPAGWDRPVVAPPSLAQLTAAR